MSAPRLGGIHHVKLPVRDLQRSISWYSSRLGYAPSVEFHEGGVLMGVSMSHPNGGPELAVRLDPERAERAAGFDYFSIAVPTKALMDELAAHLAGLGEQNAGVRFATQGWILPGTQDPDGHEVRFYTIEHHTEVPGGDVLVIDDPVATAQRREQEWLAAQR